MPVDLGYGVRMVTRAEWGARPPRRRFTMPTPSPRLWLHHTADENHGAAGMRRIQNFHMDTKGWDDIAYSVLVDDDGTVFEGRGAGVVGGHTHGDNSESHAICGMGAFHLRAPTAAMLDAVRRLGAAGRDRGWWPDVFTGGHRDAPGAETQCPGGHLYAHLPTLTFPIDTPPEPEDDDDMAFLLISRDTDGASLLVSDAGLEVVVASGGALTALAGAGVKRATVDATTFQRVRDQLAILRSDDATVTLAQPLLVELAE